MIDELNASLNLGLQEEPEVRLGELHIRCAADQDR